MMSDINEKIQENISNEVSRKQLIEVVDNYERGYYRSAIVVLYTTILYEILKQLENLRDFYNNKSAEEIIEKIENQKNNNPKSPSWEGMLIDELKSRNFITSNDYKDLEEIQRFRNYGAHPIIEVETGKIEILLRDVQEEEVKLALVNSFRIVFFNHLGLGSKYAKEIVDYAKDYISNNGYGKEFDNQFIDVYLSRTNKATYKNIFKILYKEAFVADGAIDDKQREYLINILRVVYNFNPEYCCEAITDNSYNLLSVLPDDVLTSNIYRKFNSKLYSLIIFFQNCPGIWEYIPDSKKDIILGFFDKMFISENPLSIGISRVSSDNRYRFINKARLISSSLFLVKDRENFLVEKILHIRKNISNYETGWLDTNYHNFLTKSDMNSIYGQCRFYDLLPQFKKFYLEYIRGSESYKGATESLSAALEFNMDFSDEVDELLDILNSNSQYYGARKKIKENLDTVKSLCKGISDEDFIDKLRNYGNLKNVY